MSELETTHPQTDAQTQTAVLTGDRARTVFGHTMGLVALTAIVAGLGAYVGRDLTRGWGIVLLIGAIGCVIAMNVAIRRSQQLAIGLLFGMGALLGASVGPMLAYYADVNPQALWQSAALTGLFIAGCGTVGYLTRRDLTMLGRISFFALLGLIVFGIVLVFVQIPQGDVIYAVLGLIIFAGYTMYDFQRLKRAGDITAAPLLAASIFLDIFNVFLLFLSLLGGRE